jgi:hypothetical protein
MVSINPAKDNTLYQDGADSLGNGAGQHLFVGSTGSYTLRRGVMAFDVTEAVPAGSTVVSVKLTMQMSRTISGIQSITLHRLLADWGEGTSDTPWNEGAGTPAALVDATWRYRYFDAVKWRQAGGDFTESASADVPVSDLGEYAWGPTPEMVTDVQGWLDDPSSNFGWLLKGNEEDAQTAKRFDSRESEAPERRPLLTVEYILPVRP